MEHLSYSNRLLSNGRILDFDNWKTGIRLSFRKFGELYDLIIIVDKSSRNIDWFNRSLNRSGLHVRRVQIEEELEAYFIEVPLEQFDLSSLVGILGLDDSSKFFFRQNHVIRGLEKQANRSTTNNCNAPDRYDVVKFFMSREKATENNIGFDILETNQLKIFTP